MSEQATNCAGCKTAFADADTLVRVKAGNGYWAWALVCLACAEAMDAPLCSVCRESVKNAERIRRIVRQATRRARGPRSSRGGAS